MRTIHFIPPRRTLAYGPEEIMTHFAPGKADVTMQLKDGYVEISSKEEDPYLLSTKPLLNLFPVVPFILSLFLSLTTFVFFLDADFSKFPAFRDLKQKGPSSGTNIDALDGLRAIAAITVVGDHTYGRFTGIGAGGVWLFMTLSGFLLARPFIKDPGRVFSPQYMGNFFLRRAQRIIPIYYFYITLVYLLSGRLDTAIMHYLFIEGLGHLWVIPQEIVFYICVPVIMGVNYLIFRRNPGWMVLSLIIMAVLANKYLTTMIFSITGMGNAELRLFIGVFLTGIAFSYMYYAIYLPSSFVQANRNRLAKLFSILALILLLVILLGSSARLYGGRPVYAQMYFPWFAAVCGLLIFSLVASEGGFMAKALSCKPLRAISLVSLSLYLFHPLVLEILRKATMQFMGFKIHGIPCFIATLFLSYVVASFGYSYIEKPLQGNKS